MTASASKEVVQLASSWPPDQLAIAGAQRGDSAAQRNLYESCRQHVFRLAYRMVGAADVDDAVQQSFLQLFRNIKQFASESRFETWLYRLVVNECLQMRRREIAATRQRDPIVANAIAGACILLATALPLLLCLFLVRGLYDRDPTRGLEDLLIAELSGAGHGLLCLNKDAAPRLNAKAGSEDDRTERLPPPSPAAG